MSQRGFFSGSLFLGEKGVECCQQRHARAVNARGAFRPQPLLMTSMILQCIWLRFTILQRLVIYLQVVFACRKHIRTGKTIVFFVYLLVCMTDVAKVLHCFVPGTVVIIITIIIITKLFINSKP